MDGMKYKVIADDHKLPAVVRLLARDLIEGSSYFTVSTWLRDLSDFDLEMFVAGIDSLDDDVQNARAAEVFILLMMMLASAEGGDLEEDDVHPQLSMFILFLTCESLYRKGMIEFDRNLCTFADDLSGRALAWPKGTVRPVNGNS